MEKSLNLNFYMLGKGFSLIIDYGSFWIYFYIEAVLIVNIQPRIIH